MADVRWHICSAPHLGTVEHRVCDGVSNIDELAALTALVHCLVVDLDTRVASGETLPRLAPWHVQENKWRAARYGLDAIIIRDTHDVSGWSPTTWPTWWTGSTPVAAAAGVRGRAAPGGRHPHAAAPPTSASAR